MLKKLEKATHAYVGALPCGCRVAAVVDTGDRETAKTVGEFIREGYTVTRVTVEDVRSRPFGAKCDQCKKEDKRDKRTEVKEKELFA